MCDCVCVSMCARVHVQYVCVHVCMSCLCVVCVLCACDICKYVCVCRYHTCVHICAHVFMDVLVIA